MRIYNISNCINFGYNKELNEQAMAKFKSEPHNKRVNAEIIKINDICNNAEMKLKAACANSWWSQVTYYEDIFSTLKAYVVNQIENAYPELHYRQREIDTYEKELKSLNNENGTYMWMVGIINELKDDRDFQGDLEDVPDFTDPIDTAKDESPKLEEGTMYDYVTRYIPNKFSPKGFGSLAGMSDIKDKLIDQVIDPMKNPEQAKLDEIEYGRKAPRAFLLFGPPGCGKTYIAQALAAESGLPMFTPKVIDNDRSRYINGASSNLYQAYECVKRYVQDNNTSAILFVDEGDAIASERKDGQNGTNDDNKMVAVLLPILENARGDNIFVIIATNKPKILDPAVKSRVRQVYVGLPDEKTRKEVFSLHLSTGTKGKTLANDESALGRIAKLTKGYSNRDISKIVEEAFDIARKDGRRDVAEDDIIKAIKNCDIELVDENLYKNNDQSRPRVGYK